MSTNKSNQDSAKNSIKAELIHGYCPNTCIFDDKESMIEAMAHTEKMIKELEAIQLITSSNINWKNPELTKPLKSDSTDDKESIIADEKFDQIIERANSHAQAFKDLKLSTNRAEVSATWIKVFLKLDKLHPGIIKFGSIPPSKRTNRMFELNELVDFEINDKDVFRLYEYYFILVLNRKQKIPASVSSLFDIYQIFVHSKGFQYCEAALITSFIKTN